MVHEGKRKEFDMIALRAFLKPGIISGVLFLMAVFTQPTTLLAGNDVLGEVQFIAAGKTEKSCGVWVDGQYLGYLKELKGSKKVVLLPGKHEIVLRHSGYKDITQTVVIEPGQKHPINVSLEKDPDVRYPEVTAEVKMSVKPNRAAVFVNDRYVGHVDEFDGPGQALLVAPGTHRFKITLPGYQRFETEITLRPNQKFELKTELFKGSITEAGPLIKQ
jgi:hypothetical protein